MSEMGAHKTATGWAFAPGGKKQFRQPVLISTGAHVVLAIVSLAGGLLQHEGSVWSEGGPGGAATVSMEGVAVEYANDGAELEVGGEVGFHCCGRTSSDTRRGSIEPETL